MNNKKNNKRYASLFYLVAWKTAIYTTERNTECAK